MKSRLAVKEKPVVSNTVTPSQILESLLDPARTTGATVRNLDVLFQNAAPEDAQKVAMKVINATSSAIATVHKSGWSFISPSNKYTTDNVNCTISAAQLALSVLRGLSASSSNTERAALGLTGRLMAIQAWDGAWDLIRASKQAILKLYPGSSPNRPTEHNAVGDTDILRLPLAKGDVKVDSDAFQVISTYLSYAFQVFLHIVSNATIAQEKPLGNLTQFIHSDGNGSFLSWITSQWAAGCQKQLYPLCTSLLKTTEVASSRFPPEVSMAVRIYAVRCVLSVASDEEAKWIWKQVRSIAASYVKAISHDPLRSFATLHTNLVACVKSAKASGNPLLIKDPSFNSMCEQWIKMARKANDRPAADYITSLSQSSSSSTSTSTQSIQHVIQGISGYQGPLEQSISLKDAAQIEINLHSICVEVDRINKEEYSDLSSNSTKLFQAIERLRRRIRAAADDDALRSIIPGFHQLLDITLKVYSKFLRIENLQATTRLDIVSASLESLINLAKNTFRAQDPDTYEEVYKHLENAFVLVNEFHADLTAENVKERVLELRRCLSGGFWNVGSSLYQANRWDHAVPFISRSVDVDKTLFAAVQAGSKDVNSTWALCLEQIPKRAMLLAGCYIKMANRQLGYKTYKGALGYYLQMQATALEEDIQTLPSFSVFSNPKYIHIVTNIEKITYIGTLELFLGTEVTLSSMATSLQLSPALCGAIIEQQIRSLERSSWKPEVKPVVLNLLQEAANAYSDSHPLRQVRAICTHLEYAYYDKCNWDYARRLGDTALRLMEGTELYLDSSLAPYRSQYLTTVYLWMAFHAHSNRDYQAIWTNAHKARDILAASIAPGLIANKSNKTPQKAGRNQEKSAPKTKSSRPMASSSRKTQVPRLKKGDNPSVAAKGVVIQPTSKFDNPIGFWSQIEMALNLFGALGLVQLELSYLNICCSFLKTRESVSEQDLYARLLIEFSNECAKLGRIRVATEAFHTSLEVINKGPTSERTRLLFLLRFSNFLATSGNLDKALELYEEANALRKDLVWEERNGTTLERTRSKIQRYALTALACSTYSIIQLGSNDQAAASKGYLQATRIWNAAIGMTERFDPKPPPQPVERNPFDMGDLGSALEEVESPAVSSSETKMRFLQRPGPEGWHLVLARESLEAQNRIAEHYLEKGNHRDAEYFILQSRGLAEALGAPMHLVKTICLHADFKIRLWDAENANENLKEARLLLTNNDIPQIPDILLLEGEYYEHIGELSKAKTSFAEGQEQLRKFSDTLELSISQGQPETENLGKEGTETIFPSLLANILSHQIWLSRDEEYAALLGDIESLPSISNIKVQEKILMARLSDYMARRQISQESSLGSLVDSVISVPLGLANAADVEQTQSYRGLIELLDSVQSYCRFVLPHLRSQGSIAQHREIILILVMSITIMKRLGSFEESGVNLLIALLDSSSAENLRREMLECIEQKLERSQNDLEWPSIGGTNLLASDTSVPARPRQRSLFDEPDVFEKTDDETREFWLAAWRRHKAISLEQILESRALEQLPDNWSIINISVSASEDSLLISRSRPGQQSLLFCVPLNRSNRNEADDASDRLSVEAAITELNDIMESGRKNGKRAGEVAGKARELRANWWSERMELDQRLCDLLGNIEFCWLGAFKSILSEQRILGKEDLNVVHSKLYNFFVKIINKNEKKGAPPAHIDMVLIECFSSLSLRSRDEELEDFIYFFLDLYHSTGHRVFLSDLNIDEAVLELRVVLKDVEAIWKRRKSVEDEHIFLILDKRLQGIPWESIPVLRGRSVSRIPSLTFLIDRQHLATLSNKSAKQKSSVDRITVDPSKVFYLLNPEGDLKRTEESFTPWLKGMNKVGWSGIIGRRPADIELRDALTRRDLFIYFGHGGAEQYIRGGQLRSLLRCASTMLWGCSSGAMDEAGDFDRSGTPYNYLLGGCPSLVVNLWDVTDKDIDKFAQSVFNKMKLDPETVKARKQGKNSVDSVSVVRAVAESRDVCKLKYLTGAAPIVYGIPFYL